MSEKCAAAKLTRESRDKLNMYQHEITDEKGNGVILVAYSRGCCGCDGGCGK